MKGDGGVTEVLRMKSLEKTTMKPKMETKDESTPKHAMKDNQDI